jgi:hypothetical protein
MSQSQPAVASSDLPVNTPIASLDLSSLPFHTNVNVIGSHIFITAPVTGDERPFFSFRLSQDLISHLGQRATKDLEDRIEKAVDRLITAELITSCLA